MNHSKHLHTARLGALAILGLALSACIARGPDDYRQVTRSVVDTKKAAIESCFNGNEGSVVVDFTVEKKTGKIANPVVNDKSTAPAEVGECVVAAIDGLAIEQPDMRDGAASFTWKLSK